jgi:thiosulfate/3-mercaptopyruvate sulfurtransferase
MGTGTARRAGMESDIAAPPGTGQWRGPARPFLLLALVALLLPLLAACGRTTDTPATTVKPTGAEGYPHPEYLADTSWLNDRLGDRFIRVVDLSPQQDYERGHIPGAVHVWWQDLVEVNNGTYGMLVDPASRKRVFEAAGIEEGMTVVAYDNAGGRYAARFLWTLLYTDYAAGRLLNGGYATWQAEGRPTTRDVPTIPHSHLQDRPTKDEYLINGDDLLHNLGQQGFAVVDTRTLAEGKETWSGGLRFGRIPGARSIPWDRNLAQKNTAIVRDPAELDRVYSGQALSKDQQIAVYGLTGGDAAHTFWMLRVLGYTNVRLYDGAWAQWGANVPNTPYTVEPLAVGDAPQDVAPVIAQAGTP